MTTEPTAFQRYIGLPFVAALIVGGSVGVAGYCFLPDWEIRYLVGVGVVVGFLTFLVSASQVLWLPGLEVLTRRDWDKDGRIGQRARPSPPEPGQSDADRILEAAERGHSLSQSAWSPAKLSHVAYKAARDELLARGAVKWKNPKAHSAGLELVPTSLFK